MLPVTEQQLLFFANCNQPACLVACFYLRPWNSYFILFYSCFFKLLLLCFCVFYLEIMIKYYLKSLSWSALECFWKLNVIARKNRIICLLFDNFCLSSCFLIEKTVNWICFENTFISAIMTLEVFSNKYILLWIFKCEKTK